MSARSMGDFSVLKHRSYTKGKIRVRAEEIRSSPGKERHTGENVKLAINLVRVVRRMLFTD
jgi:hypothetical protein